LEDETGDLRENPTLEALKDAFKKVLDLPTTLIVAAVDFSHVGPAFGGLPIHYEQLAQVQTSDQELYHCITDGEVDRFYHTITQSDDSTNVCGATSIYTALRLLEPVQGEMLTSAACPADENNSSYVTIAGFALR
jgi:AmmeMemoRadiSam system protein B